MDKLRIGIIIYPENDPNDGGGYSYFNTLLYGINEFSFSPDIEIINVIFYLDNNLDFSLKKPSIYVKAGLGDRLKKIFQKIIKKKSSTTFTKRNPIINYFYNLTIKNRNRKAERLLKKHKIDFVYYLKQQDIILNYPFIATIWDVSHKSTNGFPEHTLNKNYEIREKYYLYNLNKAFLILCESEVGANEFKNYYSFFSEKIKVLPLFASYIINHQVSLDKEKETLEKYKLQKGKFFIYPAQFWPHKNHYNLLLAFNQLLQETKNQDLKLVLCGSDKGNFNYILHLIQSLSLTDKIIIPGFVTNDALNIFYRNAIALTMPTFLGPTNIPIIEAAHLNCPVLCSDLAGHREILGNNAIYFNPADSEAIKLAMEQVLNVNTRAILISSAKEHITQSPFNLNNSLQVLNQILLNIIPVRKTWGIDYFLGVPLVIYSFI